MARSREFVRLVSQPCGSTSKHYAVTVGKTYEVVGRDGSCLITTTDAPGETAFIWQGRFQRAAPQGNPE